MADLEDRPGVDFDDLRRQESKVYKEIMMDDDGSNEEEQGANLNVLLGRMRRWGAHVRSQTN